MSSDTKHVVQQRVDDAAQILAAAFADDPVMGWIFPDDETRPEHLLAFMTMAAQRSMQVGHAYELAEGSGAALWCPPDVHFYDEAVGMQFYEIALAANGDRVDMVLAGLSQMGDYHPDEPHFYLANVGVAPDSQGKGLGRLLVDRVTAICDAEGVVAYLESSNPRNVSLYERAGFEVTGEIQLPEGPIMRPMVRRP